MYEVTLKIFIGQDIQFIKKISKGSVAGSDRLYEKQPIDSAYHFHGSLVFKERFLWLLILDVTRCNHQTCREAFVKIYYISHKFCSIRGKTDEVIIVLKYLFPLWH